MTDMEIILQALTRVGQEQDSDVLYNFALELHNEISELMRKRDEEEPGT